MKKILLVLLMFLTSFLTVFAQEDSVIMNSQYGIVKGLNYVDMENSDITQTKQEVLIKILSGENKGKFISVDNVLTGNPYYDINLKKGSKVILHVEKNEGSLDYSIADIKRSGTLIWLSLLFCGLVVYVGKLKGIYSLVSIFITIFLIFYCLAPMILFGLSPLIAGLIVSIISTFVTIYLVGGFNKKSLSASLGTVLSLLFAFLLSFLAIKTSSLTGFSNENSIFLYSAHPQLNFIQIVAVSMIISALGAVMDISVSIASTINEIYMANQNLTIKELFSSGMNVGRDIIGTMANTLILVYLGAFLPLILLASNIDFQKFINLNQVVTEIASAIIGSCSMVICVPITAIIAAKFVKLSSRYSSESLLPNTFNLDD